MSAVLLTGLSGSGKTTLARKLVTMLKKAYDCETVLLDGDEIRKKYFPDVGYSKEEREGIVDSYIDLVADFVAQGKIVILSSIFYKRDMVHALKARVPSCLEVYLDCPSSTCMERDPKGLYKNFMDGARSETFVGINEPYEVPRSPDLALDTAGSGVDECIERIIALMHETSPVQGG